MKTTGQVKELETMKSIAGKLKHTTKSLFAEGVIALCYPLEDFIATITVM